MNRAMRNEERIAMADGNPTVRQREVGLRLRKLRTGHGLTVEDVADKLMCSAAKISRMETGARRPILRDVRELCAIYGVNEATTAELMQLTRQSREQGWWTRYEDLALHPYIGLEQEATSITAYSMYWLPALLQTEDYARAIIKAVLPRIEPAVHEQRVEARMRRQERLTGAHPPRYLVILDEAVLRRRVGNSEVMAAQIDKIAQSAAADPTMVNIIPADSGVYPVADSNFILLEFADTQMPPVVYVEGLGSGQLHERPGDIQRYRDSIECIRDLALDPAGTLTHLADVREAWAHQ
jgi:transcriptional regulator with XRE-family HTH domain